MDVQIRGEKNPQKLLSEGELVLVPFEWPVSGVQSLGYLDSIGYILKVIKFLFKVSILKLCWVARFTN